MKKLRIKFIAILLVIAMSLGVVEMNTQRAEAGVVSWLAKKAVKHVVKKVVVNKVKSVYATKQKNFKVSSKSYKIHVSKTVKLKPKLCYGNTIKWKSSNKKVATVSSNGVVKGRKAGVATITAIPSISQRISRIKIKVKNYLPIKQSKTMTVGEKKTIYIADTVKVKSSDSDCVTANYDSDTEQIYLIAKSAGTCKVTVVKSNTRKVIITIKVKNKDTKSENTPKPSQTPKPTMTPKPSIMPDPSETAEPSGTPTPDETAEPVGTPDPSETTEPSGTPTPSETAEPVGTPDPSGTPEPVGTPDPDEISGGNIYIEDNNYSEDDYLDSSTEF